MTPTYAYRLKVNAVPTFGDSDCENRVIECEAQNVFQACFDEQYKAAVELFQYEFLTVEKQMEDGSWFLCEEF